MNMAPSVHHLSMSQTDTLNFPAGGQSWFPSGNQDMQSVMPMQQTVEQSAGEQTWFSTGTHNIKPVTPLHQNGEQNIAGQQWFADGNHNSQSGTPQPTEEQSAGVVSLERIYFISVDFFLCTKCYHCYVISFDA